MAHYLLAASPLAGHVMPMLRIGADLQRRGHTVTFLSAVRYHDEIRRLGMNPIALPADAQPQPTTPKSTLFRNPTIVDLWRTGRAEMRAVFIDPLLAQYRALQDALDAATGNQRVDAVLTEIAFTGALPLLLADRSRPPVAVCGVVPLMLSSGDAPPFGIGWQPHPVLDYQSMNWCVHHVLFADVQAQLNAALRQAGVGRSPVFVTDWPMLGERVLQLTVPATEYVRRDLPESVVFTGPVLADGVPAASELPDWWPPSKDSRTIVHVTQGTWDNYDHGELIQPTLEALADRDDILVIATTGLPEQPRFTGTVPANAYVTDYLPYAGLLPHVDVMITNGGYGGVQHALRHGIPLIVAGRTADKPEVAARIAYVGAGIDMKTAQPTPAAISAAVQRILSTDDYREAARGIGRAMAATTALDTIAEHLDQLRTAAVGSAWAR